MQHPRHCIVFWLPALLVVVLWLGGCSPAASAPVEPNPSTIVCTTAYRSSLRVAIEHEETFTVTLQNHLATVRYDDLTLQATYAAEGLGGEALALSLRTTTTDSSAQVASTLYQFSASQPPRNQFAGGHGFTGLVYAFHPTTRAELQYWCRAR
jgi:hypothetical protein